MNPALKIKRIWTPSHLLCFLPDEHVGISHLQSIPWKPLFFLFSFPKINCYKKASLSLRIRCGKATSASQRKRKRKRKGKRPASHVGKRSMRSRKRHLLLREREREKKEKKCGKATCWVHGILFFPPPATPAQTPPAPYQPDSQLWASYSWKKLSPCLLLCFIFYLLQKTFTLFAFIFYLLSSSKNFHLVCFYVSSFIFFKKNFHLVCFYVLRETIFHTHWPCIGKSSLKSGFLDTQFPSNVSDISTSQAMCV